MTVTHENPCGYKVEKKQATLYNIAYVLVVLIGAFAILHNTHASNIAYCDTQFSNLWFQKVPDSVQKQCSNRFIYRTNQIKSQFRNH